MAAPVPAYPEPRGLLKGKTVVVTAAAGTGIGYSAARRAAEEGAKIAATGKKGIKKAKVSLKDPEVAAVEEELRQIFGTKVQVFNKRGNKGKLVVEYYSLNDFDRILEVVRK